ncbi:hypothetical protein ABW19_dt0200028 [Dactylella cylindrospora]|nr:hypothetical protein ABW19_dt0200028 [Dactylella cylindrospora]
MTSTISSLPTPTPVPPPPASSSSNGMNGISGLSSISSQVNGTPSHTSSGINSSEKLEGYRNGKSSAGINGGTGQGSSHTHPPSLNEPTAEGSDSEAETVVLSQSRGRNRNNRSRYPDQTSNDGLDEDLLGASSHSKKPNGESKARPDKDDDALSSGLSSPPSRSASSTSRRPSTKESTRKRTASPSRLTHSPPRRKIPKLQGDESEKRRSLKRKARDVSPEKGDKSDGVSPDRGVRIKSSPPMSPPPLPPLNGTKSSRDAHASTGNASSATPGPRHGHTRTRSIQSAGPAKTPVPKAKAKKPGRPAPLHFNDHSDNDGRSTSSSRSNSPQTVSNRRRRPSFSGAAASPARLIAPGHKMKRDKTGRNHLHKICHKGGLEDAKACLEQDPDLLNDADNAGYLPIHAAALAGHNDIVSWLISEGSLVDKPAHDDLSTPLLDAVENMHVDVVDTLLSHGADPRHRNKSGQSSIDIASSLRQQTDDTEEATKLLQIEDLLRTALAKWRTKKRAEEERKAAESSSSRAASVTSPSHLSPPPQANHPTSSRRRPGRGEPTRNEFLWLDAGKGGQAKLKQASRDGDIEMAGKLLESGISPDPESVLLAARGGHLDVLNFLIAFGGDSDPDPKDVIRQHTKDKSQFPLIPGEETPILATIGRNNIEVLKLLLKSESMKQPRRLDSRGRSYLDIARQRGGENLEEELKLLQKAWDDAGPQKSKKSSREKPESSPVVTRKEKEKEKDRKVDRKETKSERVEKTEKVEKAGEAKKTKRLRRRSASGAPSSVMDDTATSEREISPAIARSKVKDSEKQKRKEKTVDSDYSAISDSNATVDGAKAKKRRLVLGKDLPIKSEKSKDDKATTPVPKRKTDTNTTNDVEMEYVPKRKKEKAPAPEDEDVEMADAPKPKKKVADPERQSKREQSLDVAPKRNRESSSSSNKAAANEHASDADAHTTSIKKRRRLEEEVEIPKVKVKEERQSDIDNRVKPKEERQAERESRRIEAAEKAKLKVKSEKPEKTPLVDNSASRDSEDALERKKEKKKKREEAAALAAKEVKESESVTTKRQKERDTAASDLETKKPRSEKERSSHSKAKDKDSMDIDTDDQVPKRAGRKHSGDSTAEEPIKPKKRKSNGASPAPSASDEKSGSRHLTDLSNGKSNRGSNLRDEIKPKIEPDDDAMLTDERELELQRQRLEQEKKKQQEEKKRAEEERLEKERIAEELRVQELLRKQKEEEERKRFMERMQQLTTSFYKSLTWLSETCHAQAKAQHAGDKERHDELTRIQALPMVFREAVFAEDKAEFANKVWDNFASLMPLYVVQVPSGDQQEAWISNAQAGLILGCGHDLQLTKFSDLPKRPVTAAEKQALGRNLHPIYTCFHQETALEFDVNVETRRQEIERAKFDALDGLFWLKVTDLYKILTSDSCYKSITTTYMLACPGSGFSLGDDTSPKYHLCF